MFQNFRQFPLNVKTQIQQDLVKILNKQMSCQQIIETLCKFKFYSSTDRQDSQSIKNNEFNALKSEYKDEVIDIFSKMAGFLLERKEVEIPLFKQSEQKEHTFRKEDIMFLLCSMAFNLVPRQEFDNAYQTRRGFSYKLDFSYIFSEERYKTRAFIEYLKTEIENKDSHDEKLTIRRQVVQSNVDSLIKNYGQLPMAKLSLQKNAESIENFYGELKVDFANKFIGGGALMSGCVQEELMFANHPQLYASQLICEVMAANQSLAFIGFKKYAKNKGYGYTADYDGPEDHKYEYDALKRAKQYIVAIDALHFPFSTDKSQFTKKVFDREILKAYAGFRFDCESKKIVTGNWGCGAFNGNLQAKFLIQWLVSSILSKEMVYCPFGESETIFQKDVISAFEKKKVCETYEILLKAGENFNKQNSKPKSFYDQIKQFL